MRAVRLPDGHALYGLMALPASGPAWFLGCAFEHHTRSAYNLTRAANFTFYALQALSPPRPHDQHAPCPTLPTISCHVVYRVTPTEHAFLPAHTPGPRTPRDDIPTLVSCCYLVTSPRDPIRTTLRTLVSFGCVLRTLVAFCCVLRTLVSFCCVLRTLVAFCCL